MDESEVKTMAFEYLEQYSTFSSVEEMDEHVEKHIQAHYYDLTESERAIVFTIASRSLMHPGASHLKASTIAGQAEVSTKTVYRSIKKLEQFGIIEKLPSTKLNGIKGANIYRILSYVPSGMSERYATDEASNINAQCDNFENQSSKSFNLLKHALKNNIIYSQSTVEENEPVSEESKEEKIKQYGNKYQQALYDFIHMMPFAESVVNAAYEISLALEITSKEEFILAKDTIKKVAMDMLSHLRISSTVRAVVAEAYQKARNRRDSGLNIIRYNWLFNKKKDEEKPYNPPPFDVTKYNWLGN